MYDAIIVGARCAGSPTAMLLAERGYDVLLVDRDEFPSGTISSHLIRPPGLAALDRWGLLDRLRVAGTPAIDELAFDFGDVVLRGAPSPTDGVSEHYAPRRELLDTWLLEAAVNRGVELRTGTWVRELRRDGERVTGVRATTRAGTQFEELARIVIGADGMRSTVARAVGAPTYLDRGARSCGFYSYWSGVPAESETWVRPGLFISDAPTNEGLTMVYVAWPQDQLSEVRHDLERRFLAAVEGARPRFAERLRAGTREERFLGSGELLNFYRKPYGPGWALVGDAGAHKDPLGALGIGDAFCDAQLLTEAIDAGFSGRELLPDALSAYEQQRNRRTTSLYELNAQLALLQPPSAELRSLLLTAASSREQTERFLGALCGTVDVAELVQSDRPLVMS